MSLTPSPWRWTCSAISPSGVSGAVKHETDVVLDHQVRGAIAHLRLQPGEGNRSEAPQRTVIGRRLAGVAHPELDVVDALERQEVLRLGVRVGVDVRAGLVGRAADEGLGHRLPPAFRESGSKYRTRRLKLERRR